MALHHPLDDDWTLQIKWVQKRDAGIYECQISTLPVQAYFINLNIVGKLMELYCSFFLPILDVNIYRK